MDKFISGYPETNKPETNLPSHWRDMFVGLLRRGHRFTDYTLSEIEGLSEELKKVGEIKWAKQLYDYYITHENAPDGFYGNSRHVKINETVAIVKDILTEMTGEQEEDLLVKKYVQDMIRIHGDYKSIRQNILSNLVNTRYGRKSNNYINKVWIELNKQFPS